LKLRVKNYIDPIDPNYRLEKIKINSMFPDYIIKNKKKFKKWIA
jgi:hypothetical protein